MAPTYYKNTYFDISKLSLIMYYNFLILQHKSQLF